MKVGWPWELDNSKNIFEKSIQWPKISIVTPSYNQGKYIEQTILSIINQNYPNLEYIIMDGGSTDETLDIIKKYEHKITCWISEKDNGQSHAINKGLEKCTGIIFNWLNSDDWYMPNALYNVAEAFLKDKKLKFVSGFENHIGIDESITVSQGTFLLPTLEQTIENCEVTQPSTFFKLDAIKKVKGVPEDIHYIMDGEMWVKLLLQYGQTNFKKIKKTLVNFRLHENSKTVSNTVVDNFLIDRSSIIIDLQRFVQVPQEITEYYISTLFKTPSTRVLNRNWQINNDIIPAKKLRIYFIKKFVTNNFRQKNYTSAASGIKQLMKNKVFDYFFFKNVVKLILKK